MKHLLIFLSILLLLGCVKNQGTEFLYQYKTSSGVIFKSIGDGKVQPKYKGEITNGKPNGFGVLTFPDGRKNVGEFKDGEPWKIISYDKNGNIEYKLVNGEIE